MLKVNNLCKNFGNFCIDNISFHLPKGYIMGLVGENGAGKSLLMKTIMNVYTQDSGEVYVDGINIAEDVVAARNKIGFVLDECFFEMRMTGKDNVKYFSEYYKDFDKNLFDKYIGEFGIDMKKKLKDLSKGMSMKFQIAFALSHKAELFIFDEPTASLDPEYYNEFQKLMADIVSKGDKSILISTHLTDALDRLADYILFMDKGKLVFAGTKEELIEDYRIIKCEDYKINNIPSEMIVYIDKKDNHNTVMVKCKKFVNLSNMFELERPTIEDIMFYVIKSKGSRW